MGVRVAFGVFDDFYLAALHQAITTVCGCLIQVTN